MTFKGIQQHLPILVMPSVESAKNQGYDYSDGTFQGKPITPVQIKQAILIKDGMVSGNSTVDLIMTDEAGNQMVVMLPTSLLKALP